MPKDIKHKEDGDVDLTTGDIRYSESTAQHQKDVLLARKGEYRHTPIGVGLEDFVEDDSPADLQRVISKEYTADGMTVNKVKIDNGNLQTDANY